ncbi:MAG: PfkB family carbohydrate kinase [Pseudomonadota bacterium]
MEALFIGHAYIDVTFIADSLPEGDDKTIAQDYAVSYGGNAVTAAFAAAKLGVKPDLLCTSADDWLSLMFREMARSSGVRIHERKVSEASLSFVIPKDGKRAIVRCRDDHYLHPFPNLNLDGCKILHVDGHQGDAALHYAKACRERGIATSLDGGAVRKNTDELLRYIDVAVISEAFCDTWGLEPRDALEKLKTYGCRVGAVTMGSEGVVYYAQDGSIQHMNALPVPADRVVDTNGAGDIFHGAYIVSMLQFHSRTWTEHFRFARGASAHAIQHLGNEHSVPTHADIEAVRREFERVSV